MVSWTDEAASFRDLLSRKAGIGFVLCVTVTMGFIIALVRGSVDTGSPFAWPAFVTMILAFPSAYYLRREDLLWVITRLPVTSLAITIGAVIVAALLGQDAGSDAFFEESVLGLVSFIGASLLFAVIPAAVAVAAVMLIHGAGGRSSELDQFPEE